VVSKTESSKLPETGSQSRERASVEIYRGVTKGFAWRVVAIAEDDSERALREAQALALALEQEIHDELTDRHAQRRGR